MKNHKWVLLIVATWVSIGGIAQQVEHKISGLGPENHTIKIINRGPGKVAIDALKID